MPGLRPECLQIAGQEGREEYCCICEENECSIALSPRGDTILFVDSEEAITNKPHCDCIIVLKRNDLIEIYSVELKKIKMTKNIKNILHNLLNQHQNKCINCLDWAFNLVKTFKSVTQRNLRKYCIFTIPNNIVTLIKRQRHLYRRYKPSGSDQLRIIPCNDSITSSSSVVIQ